VYLQDSLNKKRGVDVKDEEIIPIAIIVLCLGGYILRDYISEAVSMIIISVFFISMMARGIYGEYKSKRVIDIHHIIIYIITIIGWILIDIAGIYKKELLESDNVLTIAIPSIFVIFLLSVVFHGIIKSGDKDKIRFVRILSIIMIVLVLLGILVVTGILL
jgi:magnesium-transporting ATPase (P-type)